MKSKKVTAANYMTESLLNEIELLYPGKEDILDIHDNTSKGRSPRGYEVSTDLLFPCGREFFNYKQLIQCCNCSGDGWNFKVW